MSHRGAMLTVNPQALADREGFVRNVVHIRRGQVVFSQGDAGAHVMLICKGRIRLSVRSATGREATVAMLGPGEFFGEACLAGQRIRAGSATAMSPGTIVLIDTPHMVRLLRRHRAMSDRFIAHMLTRNARIEKHLIDELFNSAEQRLARTLLLLARYGQRGKPRRVLPRLSPDTLADMASITRAKLNSFLNKFRKLGFIEGDGALTINSSLLRIVLRQRKARRHVVPAFDGTIELASRGPR
jgi:CRP/FNR family transcriptional regulator, cyclic AMP receptor protein